MTGRREILRRLLLAVGGVCAAAGAAVSAGLVLAGTSNEERGSGVVGILIAIAAFFAYRALVNWVLLYAPAKPKAQDW